MRFLLLFGTIGLLALGQILFKLAAGHDPGNRWAFLLSPVFLLALCVYGLATISWIFALRAWPITVAYPAQALSIVLVFAAGVAAFGEWPTAVQSGGLLAIIAGLILLALG